MRYKIKSKDLDNDLDGVAKRGDSIISFQTWDKLKTKYVKDQVIINRLKVKDKRTKK